MTIIRGLAAIGTVLMVGAIVHGFVAGDFFAEGAWLLANPWGRVSLIDLYVGFAMVACFIAVRERSFARAAPWIVALLVLGNLVTCVYVLVLARRGGPCARPRSFREPHEGGHEARPYRFLAACGDS